MEKYKIRESWKSRLGFIFAALGSAVGLGSIWRFPYVVGENGGAIFILMYVLFLFLIGFPILVSEILIGRTCQTSPSGAFRILGRGKFWQAGGMMTIIAGFIISSFYSVIAGWSLGYLIEAIKGKLVQFGAMADATSYYNALSSSYFWNIGFHFLFMVICVAVLLSGVRKGIELGSKIMMPLLFVVLIFLVIKGLSLPNSFQGLKFLFAPNFHLLTPKSMIVALGQAFFTLSLGQGTMVTYGSYLSRSENIAKSCFPIVILNTFIALLMGICIFTIVFSVNMAPQVGPALIFETLPIVFSKIPWGWFVSILFFLLVTIAAITSEISALEPLIAYLIDEKNFSRKKATLYTSLGAFLLGIPSALSISGVKFFGWNFFDLISFVSVNILVPAGGLLAILLVGWRWGIKEAFENLKVKEEIFFHKKPLIRGYFYFTMKYLAPLLIVLVLLSILAI